ncbi:MAG: hypothetical protein ACT452_10705 [Microthrixaceae bacterium]
MTTSTSPAAKRAAPLHAVADEAVEVAPVEVVHAAMSDPAVTAARDQRFADGVRTLRVGGASLKLEEHLLMVLGGVIAPLGLVVVLLGWWGAAHSPYVFEQLPYVISGGLLGVGMIFLGSFLYFTHWLTQLVKEQRLQSAAVIEAIQRLEDKLVATGDVPPISAGTNGTGPSGGADLVATARGTMAHRRDCVVVAGKSGLRRVGADDGLDVCKLCGSG